MVVLALIAGFIGTSVGLIQADKQREIAQANEVKATLLADKNKQLADVRARLLDEKQSLRKLTQRWRVRKRSCWMI